MFIPTWLIAGAVATGYDPLAQHISRLAAIGEPTATWVTASLVVFGAGMLAYAVALRQLTPGWAWMPAGINGLASLAVAAAPLGRSPLVDSAHHWAALIAYFAIVAIPVAALSKWSMGGGWQLATVLVVVVSAIGLTLSVDDPLEGLWQRVGLTAADLWFAATGVVLWRQGGNPSANRWQARP